MRKLFLTVIALLLFATTYGQTSIVTTSTTTRPVPKVGHMLNYMTKPAWTNQSFIDSVKLLNLEIIRYPGGTESQYFDWQTGKSLPISFWTNNILFSHSYIGSIPHLSYPLSDLYYFYQQTGIKPIFCLNLLTKTLSNQIEMLQTASSLGIPIEYIELGNELYFEDRDFVNKYPNPIDYVLDIKNNWIPQLRALFPNAKIAVIGGYDGVMDLNGNTIPARINTWNNILFSQNVNANAITFHYYFPPNTTTLSNPNVTQALAAPFKHWSVLKANTVDNVSNGMECWITEYNLNDGNQTTYAIATTWTHGLYTASLFSLMLEEPKIKMLLNHQIAGNPSYASLASYTNFGDTITNRLTAEGNAMRLLHKAANGKNSATKLDFSVNPTITVNTTNYPSLVGWVFENDTEKELFILNLSNTKYSLDLSNIVGDNYTFEQINSINPLQKNITTQNLTITKGNSTTNFESEPYSLLYAASQSQVVSIDDLTSESEIAVYPNPANNSITIQKQSSNYSIINYEIFDLKGNLLTSKKCNFQNGEMTIDISNYSKQILLLKLTTTNGQIKTIKILKE